VSRLIELCAQGVPYAKIARQLGVAPSALVNWSRQHQHCIPMITTVQPAYGIPPVAPASVPPSDKIKKHADFVQLN
jgi:transposase-like protein